MQRMFINRTKLELSLCGVGQFDNSVIFAKVNSDALCNLEKRLVDALRNENINLSGKTYYHDHSCWLVAEFVFFKSS